MFSTPFIFGQSVSNMPLFSGTPRYIVSARKPARIGMIRNPERKVAEIKRAACTTRLPPLQFPCGRPGHYYLWHRNLILYAGF